MVYVAGDHYADYLLVLSLKSCDDSVDQSYVDYIDFMFDSGHYLLHQRVRGGTTHFKKSGVVASSRVLSEPSVDFLCSSDILQVSDIISATCWSTQT